MQADAPELLATNVNHWFETSGENRMVRTLDGEARAFLSDRFRPMDNFDLAEAVLPILMNTPGLRVESCEITPRRMYIKAVNEKLEAKIQRGNHTFLKAGEQDVVQAGVAISNSEIGAGALRIEPLVFRLVCWNGAIMLDQSIRKFHSGRRQTGGEDGAWEVFSEATKNLSDAALWSQVRDLTKAALEEALFLQNVAKIQAAAGERIEADPVKVVEVLQRKLDLTETEGGGILRRLVEGGDLSKWGLANALTLHSQEIEDYDRATDFERFGGQVVEMDKKSWKEIVEAAAIISNAQGALADAKRGET